MALFNAFFKRKSKISPELAFTQIRSVESLDDDHLVNSLLRAVDGKPPIVPAMCLIAYENLFLLKAIFEQATQGIPERAPSLENIARWLELQRTRFASGSIEDEADSRRYFYFHIAVLLSIAHARAKERSSLWDNLADIWVALLPGAAALRRTLDTTQLWSPSDGPHEMMKRGHDAGYVINAGSSNSNAVLHKQMTEEVDDSGICARTRAKLLAAGVPIAVLDRVLPEGMFS